MKQHGIPSNEIKHIAHIIAEKSISNIGPEEPIKSLEKYLETYNTVIAHIEEYNTKCL